MGVHGRNTLAAAEPTSRTFHGHCTRYLPEPQAERDYELRLRAGMHSVFRLLSSVFLLGSSAHDAHSHDPMPLGASYHLSHTGVGLVCACSSACIAPPLETRGDEHARLNTAFGRCLLPLGMNCLQIIAAYGVRSTTCPVCPWVFLPCRSSCVPRIPAESAIVFLLIPPAHLLIMICLPL